MTPQIIQLTEADNGKTIQAVKDDKVVITLKWIPSSGFYWAENEAPAARLEEIKHEGDNPIPGGHAVIVFKFKVVGTGIISLSLARPWAETQPPAKWFVVTVA